MKQDSLRNQTRPAIAGHWGWIGCLVAFSVMLALPSFAAEGDRRHDGRREANRPSGGFDRLSHGSLRHADTYAVPRAPEIRHEPEHRDFEHHDFYRHHDVDVDVHAPHLWNNFAFGLHLPRLALGFLTLNIGGSPYYYADGIYYQPIQGGYQEVYPPVGAAIPQPPDGSIQVYAGNQVYYYAGGAFYLQQPDGRYAIAPTPIGVVVPELPPGAVQVSVNGRIAYQFNGIYYQPVFANGVTEYQTFMP